jgi:hypothetical protein
LIDDNLVGPRPSQSPALNQGLAELTLGYGTTGSPDRM